MSYYKMELRWMECGCCGNPVSEYEPGIEYKKLRTCSSCTLDLIGEAYHTSGVGGIQRILFKHLLETGHERRKRTPIRGYRDIFKTLLHKYKFSCVSCHETNVKKLSIDHIKPVSKGGGDDFSNLQIMCRSCNSKKGAKYAVV